MLYLFPDHLMSKEIREIYGVYNCYLFANTIDVISNRGFKYYVSETPSTSPYLKDVPRTNTNDSYEAIKAMAVPVKGLLDDFDKYFPLLAFPPHVEESVNIIGSDLDQTKELAEGLAAYLRWPAELAAPGKDLGRYHTYYAAPDVIHFSHNLAYEPPKLVRNYHPTILVGLREPFSQRSQLANIRERLIVVSDNYIDAACDIALSPDTRNRIEHISNKATVEDVIEAFKKIVMKEFGIYVSSTNGDGSSNS